MERVSPQLRAAKALAQGALGQVPALLRFSLKVSICQYA